MTIIFKNIDNNDIFFDTMLIKEKFSFGEIIFKVGFIEIMENDIISFPIFNLN